MPLRTKPMRCSRQISEQMVSLAAGELAPVRAWLLRRHLRRCGACRREWETTRAVWAGLREMASEPVPDTIRCRILTSLPDLTLPPLPGARPPALGPRRFGWLTLGAGAVAAALLAFLGLAISRLERGRTIGREPLAIAQQPPRSAQRPLRMPRQPLSARLPVTTPFGSRNGL